MGAALTLSRRGPWRDLGYTFNIKLGDMTQVLLAVSWNLANNPCLRWVIIRIGVRIVAGVFNRAWRNFLDIPVSTNKINEWAEGNDSERNFGNHDAEVASSNGKIGRDTELLCSPTMSHDGRLGWLVGRLCAFPYVFPFWIASFPTHPKEARSEIE